MRCKKCGYSMDESGDSMHESMEMPFAMEGEDEGEDEESKLKLGLLDELEDTLGEGLLDKLKGKGGSSITIDVMAVKPKKKVLDRKAK